MVIFSIFIVRFTTHAMLYAMLRLIIIKIVFQNERSGNVHESNIKIYCKYPFDCKLFKADRSASASFEHRKNTKARVVIRSYDFGVDSPWKWIVKINACPAAESDAGFPANLKTISFLYVFDIRMPYVYWRTRKKYFELSLYYKK